MRPLTTCAAAGRRLQAFYDGELPVAEQIAVQSHLDGCGTCVDALSDLQGLGAAFKRGALGRDLMTCEEAAAFVATVVGRRTAEEDASIVSRVHEMFYDLHLVYAGVGAAAATAACVVIILGMMWSAPTAHPNASPSASLAAIMTLLATPGSSPNAIAIDAASHARGTARFQAAHASAEEDAVFELASIVTRDGRLISLNRLKTGHQATRDEAKAIEDLMESVTRASIETGSGSSEAGTAINSDMVWFVTRTTVRATKAVGVDLPLPPMKKRIARTDESTTHVRV